MNEIKELLVRKINKVSIVCPYYNEEPIMEKAVEELLECLSKLRYKWELILVNDGSIDNSFEIAKKVTSNREGVILVSYPYNNGRGYALNSGISIATGDIIITTEIDLSWGIDIIDRIINKFEKEPNLDCVIASPNIHGGGYKNVPLRRVFISRLGNKIICLLFTKKVTMNTGMTRGYRKEIIQGLLIHEKGKEFNLEVLLKIIYLGFRIGEIPVVLEWKDDKLINKEGIKRRSSSRTKNLIISHLNFAVFANPIRYFWIIALFCGLVGLFCISYAVYLLLIDKVAVYFALIGSLIIIISLLFFCFGVIASQNNYILCELWQLYRLQHRRPSE